ATSSAGPARWGEPGRRAPHPRSDPAPLSAFPSQQLISRVRAPGAGLVVREVRGALVHPRVDDRGDPGPGTLDLVGPREQRRIAEERVEDQRLVRVGRIDGE